VLGNAPGQAAAASLTRKLSRDGGNADELMRDAMTKATELPLADERVRVGGADEYR
jgi:hypothetical protein